MDELPCLAEGAVLDSAPGPQAPIRARRIVDLDDHTHGMILGVVFEARLEDGPEGRAGDLRGLRDGSVLRPEQALVLSEGPNEAPHLGAHVALARSPGLLGL